MACLAILCLMFRIQASLANDSFRMKYSYFPSDEYVSDFKKTLDELITQNLTGRPSHHRATFLVKRNETVRFRHNVRKKVSANLDAVFYVLASIGGCLILFTVLGVVFWPVLRLMRRCSARFAYRQLHIRNSWVRRLFQEDDYAPNDFSDEFDSDNSLQDETRF